MYKEPGQGVRLLMTAALFGVKTPADHTNAFFYLS